MDADLTVLHAGGNRTPAVLRRAGAAAAFAAHEFFAARIAHSHRAPPRPTLHSRRRPASAAGRGARRALTFLTAYPATRPVD